MSLFFFFRASVRRIHLVAKNIVLIARAPRIVSIKHDRRRIAHDESIRTTSVKDARRYLNIEEENRRIKA